jgi:potassium-transporting ATPase KdpC subunit
MNQFRPCLVVTSALFALCCFVYPGAVTAGAQVLFPGPANGSLVEQDGKTVGSVLIGQSIADWSAHPEYFWGRPTAASNDPATGITYSSGSNYGPLNGALLEEVQSRVAILRASGVTLKIPADLVTKSASGLDPHLSPASVELQVQRIATVRKVAAWKVRELIAAHTEQRSFGLVGEPRVNVLLLNLDLDRQAPYAHAPMTGTTTAK